MFNQLLRRYQQPLLVIFTFLIIISFVGFFDRSGSMDKLGGTNVAKIYGRPVPQAQIARESRKFELARMLGLQELLMSVIGQPKSEQEAVDNFAWNSLVLRHESEALGINANEEEVIAAIQSLPAFQTNGAFDKTKYAMIFENALQPRGLGKDQLEDLVRDELRLKKIKSVLGASVAPSSTEVHALYNERNQTVIASVVRLKLADFLAKATAPDEDVAKLFETQKGQLKSEEKRRVKVAAFILPTTDKPLEPKERAEALVKLGRAAEEFSIAMTGPNPDFTALATDAKAKVDETPDFGKSEAPAALGASPAVVAGAFKLSKTQPNSDVFTTDRGYYVLQLAGITETRPLTIEEAKPKLVEQIQRERAQETLTLQATEIRNKIEAELKAGKSFTDAATAAGTKAEVFGSFSQAAPKFDQPDAREIMVAAFDLKQGTLSPFTPTATGGDLIYVDQRPPIDESKFATEKGTLEANLSQLSTDALFTEWLKLRRADARVTLPKQN